MIPETASAGNDPRQSLLPYFQNLPENIPLARPGLMKIKAIGANFCRKLVPFLFRFSH